MNILQSLEPSHSADVNQSVDPLWLAGEVLELIGRIVESRGPAAAMGELCVVRTRTGERIRTQVIGFSDGHVLSMPLDGIAGLSPGDRIFRQPS